MIRRFLARRKMRWAAQEVRNRQAKARLVAAILQGIRQLYYAQD